MSDRETFGDRFKRLVKESGLSTQEIVSIAGWKSDSSYYKAARGDYDFGDLNGRRLLRLAKKLNVSPYYLANESEPSLKTDDISERIRQARRQGVSPILDTATPTLQGPASADEARRETLPPAFQQALDQLEKRVLEHVEAVLARQVVLEAPKAAPAPAKAARKRAV